MHVLLKTTSEEFSWDHQVARGGEGALLNGVRNLGARGNLNAFTCSSSRR
jgi:hypothetical protein